MSNHPQRRGELIQSASSEGWTVYVPETDSLHVLNDSARAIWELCDGNTNASEMADAISELTGLSTEHAERDVSSTLEQLRQLDLIG